MLAGLTLAEVLALVCIGLVLDAALGEPRRWHPLVAFGRVADRLEALLNLNSPGGAIERRLIGALALTIAIGPPGFVDR